MSEEFTVDDPGLEKPGESSGTEAAENDDRGNGRFQESSTIVPTYEQLAEVTRQQVLYDLKRKQERDADGNDEDADKDGAKNQKDKREK